ncbi:hypothetical protein AB0A94_16310 [Streptomyces sp. NPDC044984]|uniref:hypothetical protein n=1 Tax=Streptomyces sp. NPDC044984 TaxID=3154335 RepID=UPI0033FE238A
MSLKAFPAWGRSHLPLEVPVRFPRHRARAWAAAVFAVAVSLAVAALFPQPGTTDTLVPVAAEPGVEDDGADCAASGTGPLTS